MGSFKYNPACEKAIATTPQMEAVLKAKAEAGIDEAKAIARSEAYDEGDYHDGLEADSGIVGDTAVGRMNAKDFKSHWIEFGTEKTDAKAPLRRGAERIKDH